MDTYIKQYELDNHDDIINITEPMYHTIFEEFSPKSIKIILQNNVPVGWFYFKIPESSLYYGFVFVYVSPVHRRKGIGSFVYKEIEKKFNPWVVIGGQVILSVKLPKNLQYRSDLTLPIQIMSWNTAVS